MKWIILLPLFVFVLSLSGFSQSFYNTNTIQRIEVLFAQSNWDYILDTAKAGKDGYLRSTWVKINGVKFDSAGVKYKGNSSYNASNLKNPLHIELDHFKEQDYQGIKDIKLSNGYNEPSFVREVLLYNLLQNYTEAPRANFAQVIINGQYMGIFTNVEAITKTFLESRFYTKDNTFVFADLGGCNLRYKGADTALYYTPYTMKSDYGWTHLKRLCDTLRNNTAAIENSLDLDRTLWHLAFNNAFICLDSYTGQSTHNYYLYRDHNKRFSPIIWDLNGGIGIFARLDQGPNLSIAQMQTVSPLAHQNDTMWPLIKNLLGVPMYKRMYLAHLKTLMNENVASGTYSAACLNYQSIADTAVASDPYKFGSYSQFTTNLTGSVVIGPKTIPGIFPFMNARQAYLNTTPEFSAAAPTINSITASNTLPALNSTVYITAGISNASAAYLGKRNSIMERFTRVQMFDDGNHGDGAPGDGTYGAAVVMSSYRLQYYIYADNAGAGLFSPARAEHNYYTLYAQGAAQPGQVVINEFLSLNNTGVQNEFSKREDWIELYNTTASTLNLSGCYLTDDYSTRAKFVFPSATTIAPNGFVTVWADGNNGGMHADFKLSENGDRIMLSDGMTVVMDSVTFGNQAADVSVGKCTDGTGNFVILPYTSFGYANCAVGMKEQNGGDEKFILFPNPADKYLFLKKENDQECSIEIIDITGRTVTRSAFRTESRIDVSALESGAYFVKVNGDGINAVRKFVKE